MPSVTLTISGWWLVAIAAQVAWLYLVVRPVWLRLDAHYWRKFGNGTRAYKHWRSRWEPVAMFVAGPLSWLITTAAFLRDLATEGGEGS